MLMLLHDSMPSFMNFRWVLDLLEFKNQASQCFAGNHRCPGVWNSFPFLTWDLSMQPRTQIWFFNQFICPRACACSSNLNYAHNMHWKLSLWIIMPKRTLKNHKNSHNTPVVLCWHEKKIESNKRQWISFRPKRWDVSLPKTIMLVVRSSGLWEAYTQSCPKWDKICTTACWWRSMIGCQVSWISDEFWIY